jgi:hypothetical protein
MLPSHHDPWPRANLVRIKPQFIFRIDEIEERSDAPDNIDHKGNWIPIAVTGWNVRKGAGHGVSHMWYKCDEQRIRHLPNAVAPAGQQPYKVFSMFYSGGHGFWVLRGDATNPAEGETYHSLMFEHDENTYCSSLTNVGTERTLRVQRPESRWPTMLLPDIYHGAAYPHAGYGGLKGDLPILLALIAFSMKSGRLAIDLPNMMANGEWRAHRNAHGRKIALLRTIWLDLVANLHRRGQTRSRRVCVCCQQQR